MDSYFDKFYYGGDYNPDQWDKSIWLEDMRLFKLAGINILTLPVFSWAKLQPSENEYNFAWLDEIFDLIEKNSIDICLATSTAAQPPWMSRKYPEVCPAGEDEVRMKHGERVNFCPNSTIYRKFSRALAGELAKHYKNRKSIKVWHISNEYGPVCYCENCAKKFRQWCKEKYKTIEEVNKAWNTSFWGHTYYDWEEILPPSKKSGGKIVHSARAIDYFRFMSDSVLECYIGEYEEIKKHTPNIPITTNFMGSYKDLDYFKWAKYIDIISWDSYPAANTPISSTAMRHDLMRGLKQGQPFMLMEQTPSQQNWQKYNSLKKPGVMRLWSYQAVARGADTIMFFQMRRSRGGCEKFHGALIAHAGHENTRVFRECSELGKELPKLREVLGGKINAKAAIMFDWENWNAIELTSGPSVDLKYLPQIIKYHAAFYNNNIAVDIVHPSFDLSKYDIVVAPTLYMLRKNDAENIKNYVYNGGTFITTFFSGIVDENDLATMKGYPGELREVTGVWAEEIDALFPDEKNGIIFKNNLEGFDEEYDCSLLCDIIHAESAEVLAVYRNNFYKDTPVVTRNSYGKGTAYYIGSFPEQRFVDDLISYLCLEKGITCDVIAEQGIEVSKRENENGEYVFVLNHNTHEASFDLLNNKYVDILSGVEYEGQNLIKSNEVLILKKVN